MTSRSETLRRWQLLSPYLNRSQRALWAAAEADVIGEGGCKVLAALTGIGPQTILRWKHSFALADRAPAGSLIPLKRSGNNLGRKPTEVSDPGIETAIHQLVSEEIAGDPMSDQKWVRSSLRNIRRRLMEEGHCASTHTIARLLRKMGYSLRVAKKKQAGARHPDRDKQFRYISSLKAKFLEQGLPVISIDAKKGELIGNYRREGKIWRREPLEVDTYFPSHAECVAVPFGIYDLAQNAGYVMVGVSHNTAEFALNCLVSWWQLRGRLVYPQADALLILADGGGGNGTNMRTWKRDLQEMLSDTFGLTVTVSHFPPGCSKWNPVEYRLFSQISVNWAGRPLHNLDVMLALIRGTTTMAGLKVEARLDQGIYRTGRKVSDRQMKELLLSPHDTCPKWNYTLSPSAQVLGEMRQGRRPLLPVTARS
jgi:Rhodopirellula transposase DDE domain